MSTASHTVREVSEARPNLPYLSRMSAQRKAEFICLRLAPAVTGGVIAYEHLQSEWQGLLVFACMLLAVTLLRRPHRPLHLIPLASATLYLLAPPLGALGAVLISVSDGSPSTVTVDTMVAPVLGAWLVTALGACILHRFARTGGFGSPLSGRTSSPAGCRLSSGRSGFAAMRSSAASTPRTRATVASSPISAA